MKRTFEDLEREVSLTSTALEAAYRLHRAAVDALESHPLNQQKKADEERDKLRKKLPSYLYKVLVCDAPDPVRALYVMPTCEWIDQRERNMFEISIHWISGRHRTFWIPYYNDTLDAEACDDFTSIPFYRNVKRAWKEALRANDDETSEALAALIYAAAVYGENPEPRSTFLCTLYENESDDE